MNLTGYIAFAGRNRKRAYYLKIIVLFGLIATIAACNSAKNDTQEEEKTNKKLNFLPIKGITYFEVKRKFSNGLSFDTTGFQLEPSWVIRFISNDSIAAYNPDRSSWETMPFTYSHGNVYAFAREYFRIKSRSKDSLVMQRLEVKSKEIQLDYRSDVNIVYYSREYIFNTLKTDAEVLKRPLKQDTAFINRLSAKSNRNPANRDSTFCARQPVIFTPVSNAVKVEQKKSFHGLMDRPSSYNYMYPEYTIRINGAYKDFVYQFVAIVDEKANFYITRVDGILPVDAGPRKKIIDGIIKVYLKNLFKITPGTTLGIPHSSEISIMVVGKK